MPVSGTYTWSETNSHIELVIPLKGVSPKKVDVFTASTILKVSYPPFLLDLDLYAEINDRESRAVLKDGKLKILLAKKEIKNQTLWGQLCFEGTKEEIRQRRQRAYDAREESVQKQMETVASKKVEEERMAFRNHMALEENERKRMDDVKEKEKRRAEESMHKAFTQLKNEKPRPKQLKARQLEESKSSAVMDELSGAEDEPALTGLNGAISKGCSNAEPQDCKDANAETSAKADSMFSGCMKEVEYAPKLSEDDIPPPRKATRATFSHTKRLFKTPLRESTVKQEQEFILKNRSSLRKNVLLNANDKDIGDVDPMWLKTKGDDFYNRGDYNSAINAYSEAIEADDTMTDALDSRAACYLHLREAQLCINDCLEVLSVKAADTQSSRLMETRTRLGLAYCLNKELEEGMEQFSKVRKLNENDDKMAENIAYLEVLMKATKWKEDADINLSNGDLEKAVEFYKQSLSVDPTLVAARINRAACHLALNNSKECIDDCTTALQFLSQGSKHSPHHLANSSVLATILFPSQKVRRKWKVTLLCRRAAAKRNIRDFNGALGDLEDARRKIRPIDKEDLASVDKIIAAIKKDEK